MLLPDVCLSVAYIGPKSRTERPRKTKIGTEVAHITRDSDTTFKVKRSKVSLLDGQKAKWPVPIFCSALLYFDNIGTNLLFACSAFELPVLINLIVES